MKNSATFLVQVSISLLTATTIGLFTTTLAQSPSAGQEAIAQYANDYVSDAFDAVSKNVAFEPYAGSQRAVEDVALSASGNAIDQALLLARVVEGQVSAWRLANGRLDDQGISHLLSESSASHSATRELTQNSVTLYDPINDGSLRKIVGNHFWLEIKEEADDDWVALDPAFPDARMGQSFATARRHYDAVPGGQQQRLTVTVMQRTTDGKVRRVGRIADTVAKLSRHPISLVVRGIPQFEAKTGDAASDQDNGTVSSDAGGLLGGGGGGLFGGGRKKKAASKPAAIQEADAVERKVVGTEFRRELTYAGGEPQQLAATMVTDDDSGSGLAHEWLEFSLQVPGASKRDFRRDLFVASKDEAKPAAIRRYSIALIAGEMTRAKFDDHRQILDQGSVESTQSMLAKLKKQAASNETALEALQLESNAALAPYLINLAFAYESDVLTSKLAANAGVRVVRDLPRVLITSVESNVMPDGATKTSTTLDLRLDEVRALPAAGWPAGAAPLFQRARGMQESALEGRVLTYFSGDENGAITTEQLMRAAQEQGHTLIAITPDNQKAIQSLQDLPASVAARINDTLAEGHQVIVPVAAALIDGRRLWGWWDVDPDSGAFVGVMQSGQHQAMTQYTVTLEKVGVNDAMGYVIGAIVGSTATMTLYAAKMIEYGRPTAQLIQEVAAGIEYLTCVTCPSFEVSVTPMSASAAISSPCFEAGVDAGTAIGVSGGIAFCENYKLGISCAASLMLGTFEIEGDVSIGPDATLDLGPLSCD